MHHYIHTHTHTLCCSATDTADPYEMPKFESGELSATTACPTPTTHTHTHNTIWITVYTKLR